MVRSEIGSNESVDSGELTILWLAEQNLMILLYTEIFISGTFQGVAGRISLLFIT